MLKNLCQIFTYWKAFPLGIYSISNYFLWLIWKAHMGLYIMDKQVFQMDKGPPLVYGLH